MMEPTLPAHTKIVLRCGRCKATAEVQATGTDMTVLEAIEATISREDWSTMRWTDKVFMRGAATREQHRMICRSCHHSLQEWARNATD